MFSAKIFDMKGKEYPDRLFYPGSDTIAEVFVHHINFIIDMMNGAPRMNERFSSFGKALPNEPQPSFLIGFFLAKLLGYSEFNSGEIFNDNKIYFGQLKQLIGRKDEHALVYEFIAILNKLKIPGVSNIEVKCISTTNQIRLNKIKFPFDLIPAEFICTLINEVMTLPTYDKRQPEVLLDNTSFLKCLNDKHKNPYNQLALTENDLAVDDKLAAKIDNFIAKAEFIYRKYPNNYQEMYAKFQAEILGDLSLAKFTVISEPQPSKPLQKGFFNKRSVIENDVKNKHQPSQTTLPLSEENYINDLEIQQNTVLLSDKTKLAFVAKLRSNYFVDAAVDVTQKSTAEEKAIEAKLHALDVPFKYSFLGGKKYIIVPDINVSESVDKFIPNLKNI